MSLYQHLKLYTKNGVHALARNGTRRKLVACQFGFKGKVAGFKNEFVIHGLQTQMLGLEWCVIAVFEVFFLR